MSKNRHSLRKPAFTPPAPTGTTPSTTNPPTAPTPPTGAIPSTTNSPTAPIPPAFDERLIRLIEKSKNPPDNTAVQRPDIVPNRILEQK